MITLPSALCDITYLCPLGRKFFLGPPPQFAPSCEHPGKGVKPHTCVTHLPCLFSLIPLHPLVHTCISKVVSSATGSGVFRFWRARLFLRLRGGAHLRAVLELVLVQVLVARGRSFYFLFRNGVGGWCASYVLPWAV